MSKRKRKQFFSYLLVLTMIISLLPMSVFAAQTPDIESHWAKAQIQEWLDKKMVSGYPDGSFRPDNNITRAEFMVLVNGAFGYQEKASIQYSDVKANDWFAGAVAKAAGYIDGYPDGTMRPNNSISREEAAAIIQRISKLSSNEGAAEKFTDKDKISWSKGAIGANVATGIMGGYPDGSFKPQNPMKRAEAVVALNKALGSKTEQAILYDKSGTYGPTDGIREIHGDVEITAKGVTLQNMLIHGNLTIAASVGDGEVYLKGLTVKGDTIVKGGGLNSIYFENTVLVKIIVNKEDGKVRIVASGATVVQEVVLESGVKLEETNLMGKGFELVKIEKSLPKHAKVTLLGVFETVEVQAAEISVEIQKGTITTLKVDKGATNTRFDVAAEAKIVAAVINAVIEVFGKGTITEATVNISGVTFERAPEKTQTAPGVEPPRTTTPQAPTGSTGGGGGGSGSTTVSVTGVTLNKNAAKITVNGALQLAATVTPNNATNKNITWSSSDSAVAAVDTTGKVTGKAIGTATITVTTADGNKIATCQVNVVDKLTVTSYAFDHEGTIPFEYSRYGKNIPIPLQWDVIENATNYAILMYDKDVVDPEAGPFIHWAVTGITNLSDILSGATEYTNWFMDMGYGGPMPPPGETHRYSIVVYALNHTVALEDEFWGIVKEDFDNALQGKVLASGELTGEFRTEGIPAHWEPTGVVDVVEVTSTDTMSITNTYDEELEPIGTRKIVAKEYRLIAGEEVISLHRDNVENIFIYGQSLEPDTNETLMVPVDIDQGEYHFIVVTKEDKIYEAELDWIPPTEAAVLFQGPTGAEAVFTGAFEEVFEEYTVYVPAQVDFSKVTANKLLEEAGVYGIELAIEEVDLDTSNVKKAFRAYGDGEVETLEISSSLNSLYVTTEWELGITTMYYVLQDDSIYKAVIDILNLTPAGSMVSNVTFTDGDPIAGKIGGIISWNPPENMTGVEGYRVYFIDADGERIGNAIGEVTKEGLSLDIEQDTLIPDDAVRLGIVCYGAGNVEFTDIVWINIEDNTANSHRPHTVAVTDEDANEGIDGRDFTVTWVPSDWAYANSIQNIYILPSTITLTNDNLRDYTPVASVDENTVTWTGDETLTTDSNGDEFTEQEYHIWIVVNNQTGTWWWVGEFGAVIPKGDSTPTIESISTFDADGNGILDSLLIKTDRFIDDNSVDFQLFLINGIPGSSFFTGNNANDDFFWINFSEMGLETDALPELTVLAEAFQDADGISNKEFTIVAEDGAEPVLIGVEVNGDRLILTYSENLDEASTPAITEFVVKNSAEEVVVTGVSISGKTIELTLETPVVNGDTITVSYSPGGNPIKDTWGNETVGLVEEPVDNITP